jgi:hypothetical protein
VKPIAQLRKRAWEGLRVFSLKWNCMCFLRQKRSLLSLLVKIKGRAKEENAQTLTISIYFIILSLSELCSVWCTLVYSSNEIKNTQQLISFTKARVSSN